MNINVDRISSGMTVATIPGIVRLLGSLTREGQWRKGGQHLRKKGILSLAELMGLK